MPVPVSAVLLQASWAAHSHCDGFAGNICPALSCLYLRKVLGRLWAWLPLPAALQTLLLPGIWVLKSLHCSGGAAAAMPCLVQVTLLPGQCF